MKNDNSFMTRQQYRRMKNQRHSFYNHLGGSNRHLKHYFKRKSDSLPKEVKIKRLSKRLDKIIAIVILLIVVVYLILVFVNF